MISEIYFVDAQFSIGENPFVWMRQLDNITTLPLIPIWHNYTTKIKILYNCWNKPDKVAIVVNNPIDIDIARDYGKLSWNHIYGYDWCKQKFVLFKDAESCFRLTPNTKIWDRITKFGDYNCFLR